jgi:hypothetical protein
MADGPDVRSTALEEVTNAAFNGVLRALEARKLPIEQFPGPILIGIIAWPELRQGGLFRQVGEEGQAGAE